jgi:hypothetical protein
MLKTITHEEARQIINSKSISDDDVRLIASNFIVGQTLVEFIGNFKYSEINEVNYLESKNLIRIINIFLMVLKINDKYHYFYESKEVKMLLDIVGTNKEINKLTEVQINYSLFNSLIKYALSITESGDKMDLKAKFYGKVPSKFLSFRQDQADRWLDHFCDYFLQYVSEIKYYTDSQKTLNYVMTNIAFYLIKSQPRRYSIKQGENIDTTVSRIIKELYDSIGDRFETSKYYLH